MPPFGPISRREFIQSLRRLGFSGPFAGGRHDIMLRGTQRVTVPNPHSGDIGRDFLGRILRQVGISREEWEAV
jgi:predicted RNA binding protein YcfA (HicA-like mRNA interferase family)